MIDLKNEARREVSLTVSHGQQWLHQNNLLKPLCSEAVSKACLDPVLNLSLVVTPIVAFEMKEMVWEERNSEKVFQ